MTLLLVLIALVVVGSLLVVTLSLCVSASRADKPLPQRHRLPRYDVLG